MGFAFTQREKIGSQLRAIAAEQVDKALWEATRPNSNFGETVHLLRRRCKKMRGLIRLAEPGFADFSLENRTFRDAAARLSGARDADVSRQTFEALMIESDGRIQHDVAEQVRGVLSRSSGAQVDELEQVRLLAEFRDAVTAARRRIDDWKIKGNGLDAIGEGLENTYKRFRRDMTLAESEGTATAFHEWRKQAKYHRSHLKLLSAGAPDVLSSRIASLGKLAELLGDHHNLVVLDQLLSLRGVGLGKGNAVILKQAITRRQNQIETEALTLGRQLGVEKPGALRRRLIAYWQLLPAEKAA